MHPKLKSVEYVSLAKPLGAEGGEQRRTYGYYRVELDNGFKVLFPHTGFDFTVSADPLILDDYVSHQFYLQALHVMYADQPELPFTGESVAE